MNNMPDFRTASSKMTKNSGEEDRTLKSGPVDKWARYRTARRIRDSDGYKIFEIYKEPYDPAFLSFANDEGAVGIHILHPKDPVERGYWYLQDWSHVIRCRIVDYEKRSLAALQHLSRLTSLSLEVESKSELDFDWFPALTDLGMTWHEKRKNVLQVEGLRELALFYFKPKPLTSEPRLTNVQELGLFSANFSSVEMFRASQELRKIRLADCRKFEDIASLGLFPKLEHIWIQGFKRLDNLSQFNDFPSLKKLSIEGYSRHVPEGVFRPDLDVRFCM